MKNLYINLSKLFSLFFKEILNLKNNLYSAIKKDKIKTFFKLILSIFLISILFFHLYLNIQQIQSFSPIQLSNNIQKNVGGDEWIKATNSFLDFYENILNLIKPLLNDFLGNTADFSNGERIYFSDKTSIISPKKYYDLFYAIAFTFLGLFIVIIGLNISFDFEYVKYKAIIKKILFVVLLLITGKILMELSIEIINAINLEIFKVSGNSSDFTSFMGNLIENIRNGLPKDNSNDIFYSLKSIIFFNTNNIWGILESLPIIIPLIFILILFIYISFQFLFRFISLYFLYAIQPFSSIFFLTDQTSSITINFWKTWISLLVMQPSFILGFSIIQSILLDMSKSGPSFISIILFLVSLIFLSHISSFTTKLFGDLWVGMNNKNISDKTLRFIYNRKIPKFDRSVKKADFYNKRPHVFTNSELPD